MGAKVSFNSVTRRITITLAPDGDNEIYIDVKTDLYSAGKKDWVATESLRRVKYPIRSVAGDNILPDGSKALGSTYFIRSDWKIEPYEANHKLTVNGNFYSDDGSDPFLDTVGSYTVRIVQQVSSLVDSTVQNLPEIEYASFDRAVHWDSLSTLVLPDGVTKYKDENGHQYGTPAAPVKLLEDAMTIATVRGFGTIDVIGDGEIADADDYSKMNFIGESKEKTTITLSSISNVEDCEFYFAKIQGTLDAGAVLRECLIEDINYVDGEIIECTLQPPGTMVLGGEATIVRCITKCKGVGSPYTINMGVYPMAIRSLEGSIKIINKTGTGKCSIVMAGGAVFLDLATVVNGALTISGVCDVYDYATGDFLPSGIYGGFTLVNKAVSNDNITLTIMGSEVESGFTLQDSQKVLLAAMAGKLSGATAGAGEIKIRDMQDLLDRIIINHDEYGNRTSITLNLA